MVYETCLEGVWKVSGRYLEGPDLTCLAQFGSRRNWVVSECCLDIMEGVWNVRLRCLESTCRVSGKYMLGVRWVSVRCLGGVWNVSEKCLDGV